MTPGSLLCLTFQAGGRRFALPVESVREAARRPRVAPLPGSPPGCVGVALVRGAPVGVLDVAALTGGPREAGAPASLVVVMEDRPYALLVDRVDGIEAIAAERLAEPSAPVQLLDLDAFLTPRPLPSAPEVAP